MVEVLLKDKLAIKETIVVEGKDDVAAVKRAVKAQLIITGGFALSPQTIDLIRTAQVRTGVIIFTDPDYAGEKIRQRVSRAVPNCKHAFLNKEDAFKDGNIGVENASPENICKALSHLREEVPYTDRFTMMDMFNVGLTGNQLAGDRRALVGEMLGLGYTNAKQFCSRLNAFGITPEELQSALKLVEEKIKVSLDEKRST